VEALILGQIRLVTSFCSGGGWVGLVSSAIYLP